MTTEITQYTVDSTNMTTIITKSIVRDKLLDPLDLFHHITPKVEKNLLGEGMTQEESSSQ